MCRVLVLAGYIFRYADLQKRSFALSIPEEQPWHTKNCSKHENLHVITWKTSLFSIPTLNYHVYYCANGVQYFSQRAIFHIHSWNCICALQCFNQFYINKHVADNTVPAPTNDILILASLAKNIISPHTSFLFLFELLAAQTGPAFSSCKFFLFWSNSRMTCAGLE